VPSYVVETYLARGQAGEGAVRERQASIATAELTNGRRRVSFEGLVSVPDDDLSPSTVPQEIER
jgi:hypothetical protein